MQSDNVINSLNKSLTSELDGNVFNDFITRIQTFIDGQKWIKKPIALSPSICAQYGWKCIKPDLLECVTCGAKLSAGGPQMGNYEAYKACLGKTISNLKDSHGKHCPWPLTPSPENLVKMILMPKEEALSQFLKRVESSVSFQSSLPKIKESVFIDLGVSKQHIISLCKLTKIKTEDGSSFGKTVILLAATGWIITKEESENTVLKCNNCLRSVWCGSFSLLHSDNSQIKENDSRDTSNTNVTSLISENCISKDSGEKQLNTEEPPTKKKRISFVIKKGEPFDPLHEHRPWCMWIHDGTDNYTSMPCDNEFDKVEKISSNVPGWKIFVKSLLRNISECQNVDIKNSPSREQIKNVRSLLEKWN